MNRAKDRAALALTGLLLVGALAATPRAAAASDCGGNYVRCIAESTGFGSSDQFHERGCYSEYWGCIGRLLVIY